MTDLHITDPLGASLEQAIQDPVQRTHFYRCLLEARVYVLATSDASGRLAPVACEAEDHVAYVPFFSTEALLREAVPATQPFMILPFRDLLNHMSETLLWLNPLSDANKQFSRFETAFLRSKGVASAVLTEGDLSVHILMAQISPDLLKQAKHLLNVHLRAEEGVREAWLIQTYRPDVDAPPALVLGIEGESLPPELLIWVRDELAHKLAGTPHIEVMTTQEGHALADYMKNESTSLFARGWIDRLCG